MILRSAVIFIAIFIATVMLNIGIRIYYLHIYDSLDMNSLNLVELNNNYLQKYILMNLINITGALSVFIIATRQRQSITYRFVTAITFLIVGNTIVRLFL